MISRSQLSRFAIYPFFTSKIRHVDDDESDSLFLCKMLASIVINFALDSAVNTGHSELDGLIEVRHALAMLLFVEFNNEILVVPVSVKGKFCTPFVLGREIANEPIEAVLTACFAF